MISPSLSVFKNIRDHQFNLQLQSDIYRYLDLDQENITNHNAQFNARLIATKRAQIPIRLQYQRGHREREQERTSIQSREPIAFDRIRAETGFEYRPNRLMVGLYGSYNAERLDNGTAVNGAPVIREDGDFDRVAGEAVVRYEAGTGWSPFVSVLVSQSYFKRRSFTGASFNGVSRDNTLIRGLAGLGFDYKGLLEGSVALGADRRNFSDTAVSDVSDITLQANAQWRPRRGISVIFDALRQTEENNEINEGVVETDFSLTLDHELRQDLFLRSDLRYERDEFEASTRTDDVYGGGVGLYYVLNPKLQLETRLGHAQRSSNQAGADYDQTTLMFRLVSRL